MILEEKQDKTKKLTEDCKNLVFDCQCKQSRIQISFSTRSLDW